MLIVHVDVTVLPERVDDFAAAISLNAQASRLEKGVLRFDVVQDVQDPTHFVLVEAYRDDEAVAAHKATEHYAVWRDTVAEMMARPRTSQRFTPVSPAAEDGWISG